MVFTIIATAVIPLGWSLGPLIRMWEGFLPKIIEGGKEGTPLGCWVVKLIGVILGFKLCNTLDILLGVCNGFLMGFSLGYKKW